VLTTADASSGYAAIAADDPDWENRVAARVALRLPAYRPGRRARTVRCPILFCVCEHDLLAPARPTLRHAAQAPAGTVQRYPIGHFDIYAPPWSGRAVDDQTRFLSRHLLGEPR
jgi:pimeloyl-ACP methyl ester carboxylesterase